MPYLTYEEYKELGFDELSDPNSFKKLETKASMLLDGLTLNFYHKNNLDDDKTLRSERFKMAVAEQIKHYDDLGSVSSDGVEDFESITAGRTTIKMGKADKSKSYNKALSGDVMTLLSGTGLLNRGVGCG